MGYIEAPANGALSTDAAKLAKTRACITLAVDPVVYVHITDASSPSDAWKALKKAYNDSGLTRKVTLLQVSTTKLEQCKS